jgi:hypothetical protein
MQRAVKSHGYTHIVRIGGCERYLELGNEAGVRGVCWTLVFFCVALIAQVASICHLEDDVDDKEWFLRTSWRAGVGPDASS